MGAADEPVPRTYPRDPWTRLACEAEHSASVCTADSTQNLTVLQAFQAL